MAFLTSLRINYTSLAIAILFGVLSAVILRITLNHGKIKEAQPINGVQRNLKYWSVCLDKWNKNGNMRTMNRVFQRLGYEFVNGSNGDEWDVLWSLEYPYQIKRSKMFDPIFEPLMVHQKINHIPGINYITNKAYLTSHNRDLSFILPSFELPAMIDEFKAYIDANPSKKFVQKNIHNRGVKMVDVDNVDYGSNPKLYQEFMGKPFLIDNRTFDMGVFVLVTSIDPLRIYRFDSEVLLRFCPEPYHPFDPNVVNKYVVSESHMHYLEIPTLRKHCQAYGFSSKSAFEEYLRETEHDVFSLNENIDEAIITIITRHEKYFIANVCISDLQIKQ